jgi:hypothetical protein
MVKSTEAAVARRRADPEHPATAGCKVRRTAADLFRDIEPLDNTSAAEMRRAIQEARQSARTLDATQESPKL